MLEQAFEDWCTNRAYIDGNGNYHLKSVRVSGPIAPWNKEIKRAYANVSEFHTAAHAWKESQKFVTTCACCGRGLSYGTRRSKGCIVPFCGDCFYDMHKDDIKRLNAEGCT